MNWAETIVESLKNWNTSLIAYVPDISEEWAQTGHQPSHTAMGTDLAQVAQSCGIRQASTVDDLEGLDSAISMALREEGPWFIVAKIQETEYMAVTPIEPELTLYRMRNSFSS